MSFFHSSLLILIALLISSEIAAQNNNIQGKILDKTTQTPLPATSIYYKDGTFGTVSNNDGEFVLEKIENKIIVFSYIGYETIEYNQKDIPEIIYLTPSNIQLPELVVLSINEAKLIRGIWSKYYNIYEIENKTKSNPPFTFFYRQITKSDSVYNELIECFFTGTNSYGANNFNLQKGRYAKVDLSPDFAFTFTNFFQFSQIRPFHQSNPPKNVFNTFIQPDFDKLFDVKVDKITNSTTMGNIITLDFSPKRNIQEKNIFPGKLHILLEDSSIIKFEGIIQNVGKENPNIKNSNLHFTINYKKGVKAYPIVETVKCVANFDLLYKNVLHTANIESLLYDCSYRFSNLTGEKINHKDFLLENINNMQDSPDFWRNNPIVKRTTKEENIIKTFENKKVFGNFQIK